MHIMGEKGRGICAILCTLIIMMRNMSTLEERARHNDTDRDQKQ